MTRAAPRFLGFGSWGWDSVTIDVEVRFAAVPTDPVLRWLGGRWENGPGADPDAGAWLFSDRFGLFSVPPARRGDFRELMPRLRELLLEVDGKAPIVEAVFLGSEADAELRGLAPGPPHPGSPRPADPALRPFAVHPAFEAGAAEARARRAAERLAALDERVARLPFGLTPCDAVPPADHPAWARAWLPDDDGNRIFLLGPPAGPWLCGGEAHDRTLPIAQASRLPEGLMYGAWSPIALRPSRALVALKERSRPRSDGRPTMLALIADDQVRPVWRSTDHDDGIAAHAWIDDAHAVVTTARRTAVLAVGAGLDAVLAEQPSAGSKLLVGHAGQVIAMESNGIVVLAWLEPELLRLGSLKMSGLGLEGVRDDAIVVRFDPAVGQPTRHYAFTGVEASLAAAQKKQTRGRARPARRSAEPAAPEGRLEPIPFGELAPAPPAPRANKNEVRRLEHARLKLVEWYEAGKRGPELSARAAGVLATVVAQGIAFVGDRGPVEVATWAASMPGVLRRPRLIADGSRVFACNGGGTIVEAARGDAQLVPVIEARAALPRPGVLLDLVPVGADELILLLAGGLARVVRAREAGQSAWVVQATSEATRERGKPTQLVVDAARRLAIVLSSGKTRLAVHALDDLAPRTGFTEDVDTLRIGAAGFEVADLRRKLAFRVVLDG